MKAPTGSEEQQGYVIHTSRHATNWMAEEKLSLALSTYELGKLFLLGIKPDGRLSVFERNFSRCMGLARSDSGFWLASLFQVWRFEQFLNPEEPVDGYDARYVPVTGWTTGDIDLHDIQLGPEGPVFVATRFNCLAMLSVTASFKPIWTPPFIDRLAAEDRCHLNGLAMRDGVPAYATSVSRTNIHDGWRQHRVNGGVVLDIPTGEVASDGLSMPHSPRLHLGKLWVLQSGRGELGYVDGETGRFEATCFLPGFARGMSFHKHWAIIGISHPRGGQRTFDGLPLAERLEREGVSPSCSICVVNLNTGDIEHRIDFEGIVREIYDVVALPGIVRPSAIGFKTNEIHHTVRIDTQQSSLRLRSREPRTAVRMAATLAAG
ncbi:TIGR03032 family protein [Rhodobacteraceae bacterium ASV31]|nr:TIGR03032 family protein [Anianabacter salinae]